jgi:aryl-alcohol dehydrogenase-like predicted oxidoreductase
VIDYCDRERIAFMPWYPLQAGQVTEQRALKDVAKRHGAAPSQIALAWLLGRAPVMLPIPGTSRREHLAENVAAAGIKLSDEEYAKLRDL